MTTQRDYYRPDKFPYKVNAFEGSALTKDGQIANPEAANKLKRELDKARQMRIKEQGHG